MPDLADWIAIALQQRGAALKVLGACSPSPPALCMCLEEAGGEHHPAGCLCYRNEHLMIELAKINSRFAAEVRKALDTD